MDQPMPFSELASYLYARLTSHHYDRVPELLCNAVDGQGTAVDHAWIGVSGVTGLESTQLSSEARPTMLQHA